MTVAILTCTGDRPDCLVMTRKILERQIASWEDYIWVVVDDGKESTQHVLDGCTLKLVYIRRERSINDAAHTLPNNIIAADAAVMNCDYVLIAEDDDYYLNGWFELSRMALEEGQLDLFGEGNALYYNVTVPGYRLMLNNRHASLSATCMSKKAWERLVRRCRWDPSDPCVDLWLWRGDLNFDLRKRVIFIDGPFGHNIVQFKAMPGRKSTLKMHRPTAGYTHDLALAVMRKYVLPEDHDFYLKVIADSIIHTPDLSKCQH